MEKTIDGLETFEKLDELLCSGSNPDATALYQKLTIAQRDAYVLHRHDCFTDFSAAGDWVNGIPPTVEEVRADLEYLINDITEEQYLAAKAIVERYESCNPTVKEIPEWLNANIRMQAKTWWNTPNVDNNNPRVKAINLIRDVAKANGETIGIKEADELLKAHCL